MPSEWVKHGAMKRTRLDVHIAVRLVHVLEEHGVPQEYDEDRNG